MEIRFRATGPEGERDLKSLYHWLSVDRSVRRTARIERVEGTEPGRMSPVLDAVAAILSSAAALSEVARSYAGWRRGHRPDSAVTVVVVGEDGPSAEAVLRELGALPARADTAGHPAGDTARLADHARPDGSSDGLPDTPAEEAG